MKSLFVEEYVPFDMVIPQYSLKSVEDFGETPGNRVGDDSVAIDDEDKMYITSHLDRDSFTVRLHWQHLKTFL